MNKQEEQRVAAYAEKLAKKLKAKIVERVNERVTLSRGKIEVSTRLDCIESVDVKRFKRLGLV